MYHHHGMDTCLGGQAYVAFSRVRTLESVFLRNLHFGRIRALPAVVTFYNALEKNTKKQEEWHGVGGKPHGSG